MKAFHNNEDMAALRITSLVKNEESQTLDIGFVLFEGETQLEERSAQLPIDSSSDQVKETLQSLLSQYNQDRQAQRDEEARNAEAAQKEQDLQSLVGQEIAEEAPVEEAVSEEVPQEETPSEEQPQA